VQESSGPSRTRPPVPRLEVDLAALRHNAAVVSALAGRAGLEVVAVTKVFRGEPRVAGAFLEGGVRALADSRLSNLERLQPLRRRPEAATATRGRAASLLLLREPNPLEAELALALSDGVICGSREVAAALGRVTVPDRPYRILLAVDQGDLREGFLPEELPGAAVELDRHLRILSGGRKWSRRVHVAGLASNMACFCGVVPTLADLGDLAALGRDVASRLGRPLRVSAGNTAVLPLLAGGEALPPGLDDVRVGEGIILGRDTVHRRPLPGCRQDAVTFRAAVLEIRHKLSAPCREVAEDAFGHRSTFSDRGRRLRAILEAGRQDIVPEGLNPLDDGIEVIGATSDHLVLDVEDCPSRLEVGAEVGFSVNYACLLQAMTSPDVTKVYVGEARE